MPEESAKVSGDGEALGGGRADTMEGRIDEFRHYLLHFCSNG